MKRKTNYKQTRAVFSMFERNAYYEKQRRAVKDAINAKLEKDKSIRGKLKNAAQNLGKKFRQIKKMEVI